MLGHLLGKAFLRRRLARQSQDPVIREFYRAMPATYRMPVTAATYCALDLETTGLDPARDSIVSVGLVLVRGLSVDLGTCRHEYVAPEGPLPATSVVIHGITDDRAAVGLPLREALHTVLEALTGHVLLAHHCAVELGFLDHACRRLHGVPFTCPTVDTEVIAARWFDRRNEPVRQGTMRLAALRDRFGLPRYKAHDALMDAIGTAELFAALVAQSRGEGTALRAYLCRR